MLKILEYILQELMEMEVNQIVNAEKHQRSDIRTTYRCGYRPRQLHTRYGTLHLRIPKLRKGGYVPFFCEMRHRFETTLKHFIQKAYVYGISTRKMQYLMQTFGIDSPSATHISNQLHPLEENIMSFNNSPLQPFYRCVWVDAIHEKIRNKEGRVETMAVMIACGADEQGTRHLLAIEIYPSESAKYWKSFLENMKKRGMQSTALFVADGASGLKSALKRVYPNTLLQYCKVHFMRNVLAKIPPGHKQRIGNMLKQIWLEENRSKAIKKAARCFKILESSWPQSLEPFENSFLDTLKAYRVLNTSQCNRPERLMSTNIIERINREIRRRTRVVGVFPSTESYLKLMIPHLLHYTRNWKHEPPYLKFHSPTHYKEHPS